VSGSSHDRAACSLCWHAAEFGWWGPDIRGSHCRDCGDNWTGTAAAHCTGCHRTFGGSSTADRAGCPNCATDLELTDRGLSRTDDHRGRVWRQPPPPMRADANTESRTEPSQTDHPAMPRELLEWVEERTRPEQSSTDLFGE
jgi:hypothetical protein